jgi:hypothetical protein
LTATIARNAPARSAVSHRSSPGQRSRGCCGVTRRHHAPLAPLGYPKRHLPHLDPPSHPRLHGERLGVELEVQVGTKATQLERPTELFGHRSARRLEGDEQGLRTILPTPRHPAQRDRTREIGSQRGGKRGILEV